MARHGYPIVDERGPAVGEVTSGSFSPSLNKNIGMGWVRADLATPGTELAVLVRNQPVGIRVVKRPMYKRANRCQWPEQWPAALWHHGCLTTL